MIPTMRTSSPYAQHSCAEAGVERRRQRCRRIQMEALALLARTWMCVRAESPPGEPVEDRVRWALVCFLTWGGV